MRGLFPVFHSEKNRAESSGSSESFASFLLKGGIILFCVWHMFAVAIFALPRSASDELSTGVRHVFLPLVSPYVFTTSQWQQWNMFSPNPLRTITRYSCEVQQGDDWRRVGIIGPEEFRGLRSAVLAKMNRFHLLPKKLAEEWPAPTASW